MVQLALVYHGNDVELYRNGVKAASYETKTEEFFDSESQVILGLRHLEAAEANRFFVGSIEDARIYATALSGAQVAALRPHEPSEPQPLAWWDFKDGNTNDRMGTFPVTTLFGKARVAGGKLNLDAEGAYLIASKTSEASLTPGTVEFNMAARALREKLLADPYRPGYHFAIPEGSAMPFDPDGAIFWKGQYHLFYIYQDKRGHNWGHVSSTDLFHWRQHPTGLVDGMFSGNCFINKDGRPTMCYHQVGKGDSMAVAMDDNLDTWEKLPSSPITPAKSPNPEYRSWDPFCWIEGDTYYAIFGGNHPAIVKSKSMDGPWTYVGDLMANAVPGAAIDEDVSCADFFKLGNKQMLLCISHKLGCRYYFGEWKNEQFHPTFHEKMSWVDNSFFAPRSLEDDKGRRIMWNWIFDKPGFGVRTDGGWSGTMGLPRVLSLSKEGTLDINPPKEIEALRYNGASRSNLEVKDGELNLAGLGGSSLEIDLEMSAKNAKQFGIKVCCSPDGAEQTLVYYDAADGKIKIDTTHSSLNDEPKTVEGGPLKLRSGEPLKLRVFVDKSVVEVFANGRQAVMRRIYPSRRDSLGIRLFSVGGSVVVPKIQFWEMMPSNPF